jgi:membrane peptidoglycan carboxypeptidase
VQDEEFQFFAPHARHRVLSPQTLERMNEILVGVVERGTGKQAAVEGYTVAGKTGTSQKVEHGTYSHSKVLASFAGYVPAEAPQLAIVVLIDEPRVAKWGGEAAAPVFKRVAQQALYYLQVPSRQAQTISLDHAFAPVPTPPVEDHEPSRIILPLGARAGERESARVALSTGPKIEKERRP